MKPTAPSTVTLAQWLAVVAIWGLAIYGALAAPKAEVVADRLHPVACS